MHEVDQNVVVMYTLVKIVFNVFESYESYEGFENFIMVIVNCFEEILISLNLELY